MMQHEDSVNEANTIHFATVSHFLLYQLKDFSPL